MTLSDGISDFFTCLSNHNLKVIHKLQTLHWLLVHQAVNGLIHLENKNPAISLYSYNYMTKTKLVTQRKETSGGMVCVRLEK